MSKHKKVIHLNYRIASGLIVVVILAIAIITWLELQRGDSIKLDRIFFFVVLPLVLLAFFLWRGIRWIKFIMLLPSGFTVYAFVEEYRRDQLSSMVSHPRTLISICAITFPMVMATVLLFSARKKNTESNVDALDQHFTDRSDQT